MRGVCQYCGIVLFEGPPPTTHGVCGDCYREVMASLEIGGNGMPLLEQCAGCNGHPAVRSTLDDDGIPVYWLQCRQCCGRISSGQVYPGLADGQFVFLSQLSGCCQIGLVKQGQYLCGSNLRHPVHEVILLG